MKKLKHKLLCSCILLIGIGYILFTIINNHSKSVYSQETNYIQGKILSYSIDGDLLQLEIKAKEKLVIFYTISSEKEKTELMNSIRYGDIYDFYGTLEIPSSNTNFHLFSYRKYLLSKKIYYIMNVDSMKLYKRTNSIFYIVKNYLCNRVHSDKNKSYLNTFIFGNTDDLGDSVLSKYRACGISHLIAISGMHIGLFSMILLRILKKLPNFIRYGCVFVFLGFYAFLVGFSPSVTRAVLSFIILSCFKEKISGLKVLLFLAFVFLLYNPFMIYNTGFLFSYIVSFFLILCSKTLKICKNYFQKILVISWVSFLAGIPIISISYFEVNLLSPFLNLLFVPMISFVIFPLAFISFLFPFLNFMFSISIVILETLLSLCNSYLVWNLEIPYMNIYWILGYYIVLYVLIHYQKLKYTIMILLFLFVYSYQKYFNGYLVITMIDIGQGDSILIQFPYSKANILIDTGGKITYHKEDWQNRKTKSLAEKTLIPYLKSIGVHSLDYLITSHGDYDHMGEAMNLVNDFKVERVIFNCGPYNDLENELMKVLDKKKIKYYSCIKELNIDRYKLGFLNTKTYDNENDNSSVIYFNYNNFKFLFMGDAGVEKEKDILGKYSLNNIDFLKVGHHGSNTSSSEDFINHINPRNCLISVGKNNRYGHPKQSVLDNLIHCNIYRTDINGSIEMKLKKKNYKIKVNNSTKENI